jgi:hypothetical protein
MRAIRKLIVTELKLHIREPVPLVFTLILPFIILIVMGEVFGRSGRLTKPIIASSSRWTITLPLM